MKSIIKAEMKFVKQKIECIKNLQKSYMNTSNLYTEFITLIFSCVFEKVQFDFSKNLACVKKLVYNVYMTARASQN